MSSSFLTNWPTPTAIIVMPSNNSVALILLGNLVLFVNILLFPAL